MDKGQKKYMRYRYNLPLRFREQLVMALGDKAMEQKELAKKAGVSLATVNSAYNGRTEISLTTWAKLFAALNIDLGFRSGGELLDLSPDYKAK